MTPLDKVKLGVTLLLDGQHELAVEIRALVERGDLMTPDFDRAFDELGVALDLLDQLYKAQSGRTKQTDALCRLLMSALAERRDRPRVH